MGLSNKGLTKLAEECCELGTVCAKKISYMRIDKHPDGKGSLKGRLEEEIADVLAAIKIVRENFNLDKKKISGRVRKKYQKFKQWSREK